MPTILLNERCDQLAVEASMQPNLLEDTGYQPE
jgi:ribonuclease HI